MARLRQKLEEGSIIGWSAMVTKEGLKVYRSQLLLGLPWLAHGFSTRGGGYSTGPYSALNLGTATGDDPETVRVNRRKFFSVFGLSEDEVYSVKQVHGDRVVTVEKEKPAGGKPPEADGLVTALPGTAVVTVHADCVPVIIVDPVHRATAVVHAGWRGTLAGIVCRAVEKLQSEFQTKPEECLAAIGPAVGRCCYRMSCGQKEAFNRLWPTTPGGSVEEETPDLVEINHRLLLRAGLTPGRIEPAGICTSCHEKDFFSYRREQGRTGRMLSLVVMKQV